MSNVLINTKEVCERTSLSRTAIFKHREANNFPEPVQVSEGRIAFVAAEIDQWIADRISARECA